MGSFSKYWWKILGVLLVVFSVIMSFIVPLSPGLLEAGQGKIQPGTNVFDVQGYNSSFSPEDTRIWIASGNKAFVEGRIAQVHSPERMSVQFDIPQLPAGDYDLVVQNPRDGSYLLSNAFHYTGPASQAEIKATALSTAEESYFSFPFKTILYETIRNLYYHVTMWFALSFCMLMAMIKSIQFLASGDLRHDRFADQSVKTGLWFAILGLITGSIWARFTWGAWWVDDTKLNGAAISTLIYLAYLILRNSTPEEQKKARISAVYNIFAFIMLVVFIQVLPRMTDSLHPGNGGNPAFSQYDMDNNMRLIFYPAVLGWILVGLWITTIRVRMSELKEKHLL